MEGPDFEVPALFTSMVIRLSGARVVSLDYCYNPFSGLDA